jgi:hypothetical protein
MGVVRGGLFMAGFLIVFEFAGVNRRTAYIALTAMVWPPVQILATTMGGVLVDGFGYIPALWTGMGVTLAVLAVVIVVMPEPRKHVPMQEVIVPEEPMT